MDGEPQPIRHGDPLLFEWAGSKSAAELVGERVLVEQNAGAITTVAVKELRRDSTGFVLHSSNPSFVDIPGDRSMRVIARLVRPLQQGEISPFADRIGERLARRDVGAIYGLENDPQFQRSGYCTNGTDALLLVTLNKDDMTSGHQYIDQFESPEIFSWSSQSATAPESKRGREVLDALRTGIRLHLWVRPNKRAGEFEYCGLIAPVSHEGSKPMQVQFRLITPLNDDAWRRLSELKLW